MAVRSYSLFDIWPIINRWKRLVGVAVGSALVVSLIVALLLPNIYKSTAIFYPTNPETTDPDRIMVEGSRLAPGGRGEDLDRVITIGQSQPVAEAIIRRFHLYEHYNAGTPGNDKADNAVLREFTNNMSIVHNERDAIELTFKDEDKVLASNVANALVAMIDSVNQQLTLTNRRRVVELYGQQYEAMTKSFTQARQQLLSARRRYGIYGLEQESKYLAKEILKTERKLREAEGSGASAATIAGLRRALTGLTRADGGNVLNLENYVQGIDSLELFTTRTEDLSRRLVKAQGDYETAKVSLESQVSSLYIVQPALPATKQAEPVRWLIVVSAVFLTFVLSVLLIVLLELYRANRHHLVTN
ncbi:MULTISPECIES: hypothetical protein [Hymenobacter]|uniref:Polysaccharide chain length determinant N-terminal domain-containing protein n=1 Tax=Hymenobacter profundi TaxID=1982110 RepID=A0ABS6X2X2_9BACT|nr:MULTISPECIES: hypothetical protein [Hymenobacter]MBW3130193.1 hypothetical protein [Hymenobacter profundi]